MLLYMYRVSKGTMMLSIMLLFSLSYMEKKYLTFNLSCQEHGRRFYFVGFNYYTVLYATERCHSSKT